MTSPPLGFSVSLLISRGRGAAEPNVIPADTVTLGCVDLTIERLKEIIAHAD